MYSGDKWISANKADLPLTCRMRKGSYEYASKRKTELGSTLSVIAAILYLREKRRKGKVDNERVRKLVQETYLALQEQVSCLIALLYGSND